MDWREWHGLYDRRWALKMRLALVQNELRRAIAAAPKGRICMTSLCAGDGRDLAGAMRHHPRAKDVSVALIEIDKDLVAMGRARFERLHLADQVDYRAMDATDPASYDAVDAADVVVACGMLGLVSERTTPNLVRALAALIKPGGHLIWTRSLVLRSGPEHLEAFRALLAEHEFQQVRLTTTMRAPLRLGPEPETRFVVGTHAFQGAREPLPAGPLFEILDL